jgi:hypothetical protein
MEDTLTAEWVVMDTWLDDVVACEGFNHPIGTLGHTPDAPAEYRIIAPCCGASVNQCATRVHVLRQTDEYTRCDASHGGCGTILRTGDLKVVPI